MSQTNLFTAVKQWCLLALVLGVVCAVLCANAQEDSEAPASSSTFEEEPSASESSASEEIVSSSSSAASTTTECTVANCAACHAGSFTRCASCANGYSSRDDGASCQEGDGGFARPTMGVVAAALTAMIVASSILVVA